MQGGVACCVNCPEEQQLHNNNNNKGYLSLLHVCVLLGVGPQTDRHSFPAAAAAVVVETTVVVVVVNLQQPCQCATSWAAVGCAGGEEADAALNAPQPHTASN
jgi:hypothetical protein